MSKMDLSATSCYFLRDTTGWGLLTRMKFKFTTNTYVRTFIYLYQHHSLFAFYFKISTFHFLKWNLLTLHADILTWVCSLPRETAVNIPRSYLEGLRAWTSNLFYNSPRTTPLCYSHFIEVSQKCVCIYRPTWYFDFLFDEAFCFQFKRAAVMCNLYFACFRRLLIYKQTNKQRRTKAIYNIYPYILWKKRAAASALNSLLI